MFSFHSTDPTLAEFLKNDSDFQSCMIYGSESSIFGLKMGGVQKNAFNDSFYNIFGKDVLPTNSHYFYSGKELQFGNEKKIPYTFWKTSSSQT